MLFYYKGTYFELTLFYFRFNYKLARIHFTHFNLSVTDQLGIDKLITVTQPKFGALSVPM